VSFTGEQRDIYDRILSDFQKEPSWGKTFSTGFLRDKVNQIIANTIATGDSNTAAEHLASIVTDLEGFDEEYVIYVPIDGLTMDFDALIFGNITLTHITDERFVYLLNLFTSIMNTTTSDDATKKVMSTQYIPSVIGRVRGGVCAVVTVKAEHNKATDYAIHETERALEILRYVIPALYPSQFRVNIAIQGELAGGSRTSFSYSSHENSVQLASANVGRLANFELNADALASMVGYGFFALGDLLTLMTLNDLQESLLRAVHWSADAHGQRDNANKVTSMMIALESLLSGPPNSPISTAVSESVAIILGNHVDSRLLLKKLVKDLYDKRSRISHGGTADITDEDVRRLQNLTGNVIVTLALRSDDFETRSKLSDWVERQKFS